MKRRERALYWKCAGGFVLPLVVTMFVFSWAGVPKTAGSGPRSAVRGGVKQIYRLGLGPGDLLLESIREFIKEHDIKDGAVLTGIGSLSECRLHWPTKAAFPPTNEYKTFKGVLEITGVQGIIADGEPHLHMMVAEKGDSRAAGGHMEEGCKVLYLTELTIAEFDGPPMIRRPNEHNVKMLQKK